ncbi:hypothetical protein OKW21_005910 [Catalinimonas alkaloidigena]|uniref:hypothetical protein n=1 Tax=Catalinimonas alkaloidigena TaxID=1075417 RepID=UPI0024058957|nr:hypothetical protein [Catalinimonas alkaloidigena]MDF9794739.1 hypothetical protein [Catalinimonas alkaloidigena]MDF9800647.1 hypothetical protein [Catalinimonas alkaloidigena]
MSLHLCLLKPCLHFGRSELLPDHSYYSWWRITESKTARPAVDLLRAEHANTFQLYSSNISTALGGE